MTGDKTIAADPPSAAAFSRRGKLLAQEGRAREALKAFQAALDLAPDDLGAWEDFSQALAAAKSYTPTPELLEKIGEAISRGDHNCAGALAAAGDILARQFQVLEKIGAPASWASLAALERKAGLANLGNLLVVFLEHGRTKAPGLEAALTAFRSGLLRGVLLAPDSAPETPLDIAAALAIHCFNNEYVFAESTEDAEAVDRLRGIVVQQANEADPAFAAAVLGAYRPLGEDPVADRLVTIPSKSRLFGRLLDIQIHEPRREQDLAKTIAQMTPIADAVSEGVRRQYEENPYPRWQRLMRRPAAEVSPAPTPRRILVAGCGTGRHPLLIARAEPHAQLWAMDLSLRSLAYARRKAEEHRVNNITFVQGDILELPATSMRFDMIACGGVLHHMRDPAAGLRALQACLADGGTLALEIYTESGRTPVAAGIALREHHRLLATPRDIRRFRELVFSLPPEHPAARLAASADFYAMSDCRDQTFHVQEHRFALPDLSAMATQAGFRLLKIHPKPKGLDRFREMFPTLNPDTDIEAWAEVEREHPGIFGSMYRMDLAKI